VQQENVVSIVLERQSCQQEHKTKWNDTIPGTLYHRRHGWVAASLVHSRLCILIHLRFHTELHPSAKLICL